MSTPTWLAIKRREAARRAVNAEPKAAVVEKSYRDLQVEAKELDIPANQSREDLEAALEEAQEAE